MSFLHNTCSRLQATPSRQHPDNVLLIEYDGGSAIACALASGAHIYRSSNRTPTLPKFCARHYPLDGHKPKSHGHIWHNPRDRFDIIHLENWGTSIPGTAALNQEHLLTKEALTEYLNHLTADGVVTISRRLLLPPSDSLRLWQCGLSGPQTNRCREALVNIWRFFATGIPLPLLLSKRS